MSRILNWGIIGTGHMASTIATAINTTKNNNIIAVGSRTLSKAKDFAIKHSINNYYDSYDALTKISAIDIIYIALPHYLHAEWAIKFAKAKKGVLCEKPSTINYRSMVEVSHAVKSNSVFYMEAFMYKYSAQTRELMKLIANNTIGKIHLISSSFCYNNRHLEYSKTPIEGKGSILDVGCYTLSMARMIASTALRKTSPKVTLFQSSGILNAAEKYDEVAICTLEFENQILAELSSSITVEKKHWLTILGSKGRIEIPSPWFCRDQNEDCNISRIFIYEYSSRFEREMLIENDANVYQLEIAYVYKNFCAERVRNHLLNDSLQNSFLIDKWRNQINVERSFDSIES